MVIYILENLLIIFATLFYCGLCMLTLEFLYAGMFYSVYTVQYKNSVFGIKALISIASFFVMWKVVVEFPDFFRYIQDTFSVLMRG